MTHEEYKDLLALDALDALDAAEAHLLRDHLATCEECRREQIEWRDAAALLALSVEPISPPENLRALLLSRLDESQRSSLAKTNGGTNSQDINARSEASGKVLPLRTKSAVVSKKVFFGKRALWSGALAASLVIAALIVSFAVFRQRNTAKQDEQARLSNLNAARQPQPNESLPRDSETQTGNVPSANQNNDAPTEISHSPNRNNNNRQDKKTGQRKAIAPTSNQPQVAQSPLINPAASAANAQVVQLSGTDKAPQSHARLIFDKSERNITVYVSDLPPPAAGQAYQLWFIVKGHPIAGSVFVTGQQGQAMVHGHVPVEGRGASVFAITLEKSNGANKPTGDKYLLGTAS